MSRANWDNDKLFFRLINNKSDNGYWQNINELRKRGSKEIFDKCIELTNSAQNKERIIGIDIIAQISPHTKWELSTEKTQQIFLSLLYNEQEFEVQKSLLFGIGHNNTNLSDKDLLFISTFKDSTNNLVRESTVFSILGIDNEIAIETLIYLSKDKVSSVRNWATFGLGCQIERDQNNIREALYTRLKDKHQETKLEAIARLAKRKDASVKGAIYKELENGECGLPLVEAIEALEDKDLLSLLKESLK